MNDRSWSLAAGLSEKYLAVQRNRAAEDPEYLLPEKAASRLASAARISVEWLRHGRGKGPSGDVQPGPDRSNVELAFLEAFGKGGFSPADGLAAREVIQASEVPTLEQDRLATSIYNLLVVVSALRAAGLATSPSGVLWSALGLLKPLSVERTRDALKGADASARRET